MHSFWFSIVNFDISVSCKSTVRPISRFGPRLQSPAMSRIGAGCRLKPCRCSILSSLSCCWTLALACRDFPSEVRCQVAVIPGKCSTLKHASSAGACSWWRPDQVGVPPMFLWSCLAAGAGRPTGGGWEEQLLRQLAATSLVAQLLLACTTQLCRSWRTKASWPVFTLLLPLLSHQNAHLHLEGQTFC